MENKKYFSVALLVILFLPSCAPLKWIKDKLGMGGGVQAPSSDILRKAQASAVVQDGSPILASIDGKPVITEKSFKKDFNEFVEKNKLQQLVAFMPDAEQKFLEGLLNQKIIDKFVAERGIDESAEYQKELQEFMKSAKQMLNTKYFTQQYPVQATDADAQAFYDKNKTQLKEVLISRGGVAAKGIQFDTKEAAQGFLASVKGKEARFDAVAKDANLSNKVRDFKQVTAQSGGVDPSVRGRILRFQKFPSADLVASADKTFWVVAATSKEEAEYRPYEQVAQVMKQYADKQKRMTVLEGEIGKLKTEYQVSINKEYFSKNQPNPQESLNRLIQQQQLKQAKAEKPAEAKKAAPQVA